MVYTLRTLEENGRKKNDKAANTQAGMEAMAIKDCRYRLAYVPYGNARDYDKYHNTGWNLMGLLDRHTCCHSVFWPCLSAQEGMGRGKE